MKRWRSGVMVFSTQKAQALGGTSQHKPVWRTIHPRPQAAAHQAGQEQGKDKQPEDWREKRQTTAERFSSTCSSSARARLRLIRDARARIRLIRATPFSSVN